MDLNNRSPLLSGYRNILKLCYQYNITNLTVPLLLLSADVRHSVTKPEEDSSISTTMKRIEVVLKATKGLIMEQTRSLKHSNDSRGTEKRAWSIEFLLPSQLQKLVGVFDAARQTLSEVFRA
jgi:hypothetical protein